MSNAVYPSFPGIRPVVSRMPLAPPVQVRTTPSQREYRARDATLPRYKYSLSYEVLRSSAAYPELQTLAGFFNARGGRFDSFLFDDEDDNAASGQTFGIGNGSTASWQGVRVFGGFVEPVDAFKGAPLIMADGAPCTNQLPNASLGNDSDSDGIPDDWVQSAFGTTGTITHLIVAGRFSGSAARVAAAGLGTATTDRVGLRSSFDVPITAGQSLALAADFRDSGDVTQAIRVNWLDGAAATVDTSTTTFANTGPTWTTRSTVFTAPAGAVAARCFFWVQAREASAGAAWVELNRAKVELGPAPTAYTRLLATVADGSGLITFREAPGSGQVLTWTGGFYRRVRFERDELEVERFLWELWEGKRVELRSTREG